MTGKIFFPISLIFFTYKGTFFLILRKKIFTEYWEKKDNRVKLSFKKQTFFFKKPTKTNKTLQLN